MIHEELSGEIIGAAMDVLYNLKPGLDEKLYENALVIELTSRGHKVEQQRQFSVLYKGTQIGSLIPDLIVDSKVVVDPKVAASFNDTHVAQMIGYLAITGLELALLLIRQINSGVLSEVMLPFFHGYKRCTESGFGGAVGTAPQSNRAEERRPEAWRNRQAFGCFGVRCPQVVDSLQA